MGVLTAYRKQVWAVHHVGHRTRMHEGTYVLCNSHEHRSVVYLSGKTGCKSHMPLHKARHDSSAPLPTHRTSEKVPGHLRVVQTWQCSLLAMS